VEAIAIEETLLRPIATLLACALVPIASAIALWKTLVGALPEGGTTDEEARALAPFRGAAFLVGFTQVQLAWVAGATALGPGLVPSADHAASDLFGALCAVIAFCAGGVGRLIEDRARGGREVRDAIALRLRLVPFFAGPVLAAWLAARLPVIAQGPSGEVAVRWEIVAASLAVCAIGIAFGGLAMSVVLRAVVPASEPVRAIAREVAAREGVRLFAVLALPTGATRFANAAAIPWARTMIVTDRIVALLSTEELRAVLAHEAGHLSEGWRVIALRLGAVLTLVFVLTTGVQIGGALHENGDLVAMTVAIAVALPMVIALRRLARRMEERADAQARRSVGPEALADALTKIHEDARMPVVTGARRVHPDLYDRLTACGRDPGPRPPAPRRRLGLAAGLAGSAVLVLAMLGASEATEIAPREVPTAGLDAARWRLRIDPWDADAVLALAWATRGDEDLSRATRLVELARRIGAPDAERMELEAEILAARGECEQARALFDRSLEARAVRAMADQESALELGGWHIPPTLVRDCRYGAVSPSDRVAPSESGVTRP
jgi:Zn-dependent protease with chaperone function